MTSLQKELCMEVLEFNCQDFDKIEELGPACLECKELQETTELSMDTSAYLLLC